VLSNRSFLLSSIACLHFLNCSIGVGAQNDSDGWFIKFESKSMNNWYYKYFPDDYCGEEINQAVVKNPEIVTKIIETFSTGNISHFASSEIGALISQNDPTQRKELFFSIVKFKLDKAKLSSPAGARLRTFDKEIAKYTLENMADILKDRDLESFYKRTIIPERCSRLTRKILTDYMSEVNNCLSGFRLFLYHMAKTNSAIDATKEYAEFAIKIAEYCLDKSLQLTEK
jgi:hypothetical protein